MINTLNRLLQRIGHDDLFLFTMLGSLYKVY